MAPPLRRIRWRPAYIIVPSRYPPISPFEQVADPSDLEAVFAIEAMTNERLRDERGQIFILQEHERLSDPGAIPVMAALTHMNPEGDRFTDGTFGTVYASKALETAIAETAFHLARFLERTCEPAQHVDMRVYACDINADLIDIETDAATYCDIYSPDDYTASQSFAAQHRQTGADGIVYASVRHQGGSRVALFRPRNGNRLLIGNCRHERHLTYVWNGITIEAIYEKSSYTLVIPPLSESCHQPEHS